MIRVKMTGFLAVLGVGRAISTPVSYLQAWVRVWANLLAEPFVAHVEEAYEDIIKYYGRDVNKFRGRTRDEIWIC
jgi:hypothetical protein